MTCIVAVRDDERRVWMGCDAMSYGSISSGHPVDIDGINTKIFHLGENMLVGYTTSFRLGQIIRYHVDGIEITRPSDMVTKFIPAVRSALREHGYTTIKNNSETGGVFLVAVGGDLYHVDCDFQVAQYNLPYYAVGCGDSHAMGALYILDKKGNFSPKKRVLLALEAAEAGAPGVCGPYLVLSTT